MMNMERKGKEEKRVRLRTNLIEELGRIYDKVCKVEEGISFSFEDVENKKKFLRYNNIYRVFMDVWDKVLPHINSKKVVVRTNCMPKLNWFLEKFGYENVIIGRNIRISKRWYSNTRRLEGKPLLKFVRLFDISDISNFIIRIGKNKNIVEEKKVLYRKFHNFLKKFDIDMLRYDDDIIVTKKIFRPRKILLSLENYNKFEKNYYIIDKISINKDLLLTFYFVKKGNGKKYYSFNLNNWSCVEDFNYLASGLSELILLRGFKREIGGLIKKLEGRLDKRINFIKKFEEDLKKEFGSILVVNAI